jgi:hypothetical protein
LWFDAPILEISVSGDKHPNLRIEPQKLAQTKNRKVNELQKKKF